MQALESKTCGLKCSEFDKGSRWTQAANEAIQASCRGPSPIYSAVHSQLVFMPFIFPLIVLHCAHSLYSSLTLTVNSLFGLSTRRDVTDDPNSPVQAVLRVYLLSWFTCCLTSAPYELSPSCSLPSPRHFLVFSSAFPQALPQAKSHYLKQLPLQQVPSYSLLSHITTQVEFLFHYVKFLPPKPSVVPLLGMKYQFSNKTYQPVPKYMFCLICSQSHSPILCT